jgi:hypothetical protein
MQLKTKDSTCWYPAKWSYPSYLIFCNLKLTMTMPYNDKPWHGLCLGGKDLRLSMLLRQVQKIWFAQFPHNVRMLPACSVLSMSSRSCIVWRQIEYLSQCPWKATITGLGRTGPTLCTGPVFLWISTNQLGRVWFLRPLSSFPTSHRDISPQKPITAPQACGLLVYCVLLCLLITVDLISGFRHLIEDSKWISTYPGCPASSGYDAMCIELQSGEVLKAKHATDIHVYPCTNWSFAPIIPGSHFLMIFAYLFIYFHIQEIGRTCL